jgi:DNA-binding NtrC family response regulator
MAHRILIVDDDQEFNLLLTDVFAQADYAVETCRDVNAALERLERDDLDLLVTDFRMPGPSGLELVKRVREARPALPIIMVSGFLENGMIRDLIRFGVGGIFMKPLNIFSLLKKAEELIEREEGRELERGGAPATGFGANVGFPFRAFPCRDPRSRDFARQVQEFAEFGKTLILLAEAGTDLRTLCEDLAGAGERCPRLAFFGPDEFDETAARAALGGTEAVGGTTLVFLEGERMGPEQRALVYTLAHQDGAFNGRAVPVRFIFCFDREIDAYYDEGLIDEEFYLFLGTTELRVPTLREIPEDLPLMAETILAREAPGKELEGAARAFLQRHDWPGNLEALREKLRLAARFCRGSVITVQDLRQVLEETPGQTSDGGASADLSPLEAYLRARREDYLGAFERILGRRPGSFANLPT